jgi:hypothetical protein
MDLRLSSDALKTWKNFISPRDGKTYQQGWENRVRLALQIEWNQQ